MIASTPRFRFSLRTMLLSVGLLGTVGYWLACESDVVRAQRAYEHADGEIWTAGHLVPSKKEKCEASLRLYQAESRVPLADSHAAAVRHRDRMQRLVEETHGLRSEWRERGAADDPEFVAMQAAKAEVRRYYAEAETAAR